MSLRLIHWWVNSAHVIARLVVVEDLLGKIIGISLLHFASWHDLGSVSSWCSSVLYGYAPLILNYGLPLVLEVLVLVLGLIQICADGALVLVKHRRQILWVLRGGWLWSTDGVTLHDRWLNNPAMGNLRRRIVFVGRVKNHVGALQPGAGSTLFHTLLWANNLARGGTDIIKVACVSSYRVSPPLPDSHCILRGAAEGVVAVLSSIGIYIIWTHKHLIIFRTILGHNLTVI